ncbi:hypothetical protein [Erythrobacter sp. THAF29]|uniref:hypothetical protein n=1 Tax=Erythrobacter sp. THAF29 TaxID=2587851 RepID=UPI001268948A|nr:hypothetical protein [Erythrobacter sp. THAF29]QFT76036.1 hypothetical protein FIU90_00640 [Erythrobacter sp. THAF29]
MTTLQIWADLLRHKVGIAAAFLLFLFNIPVSVFLGDLATRAGYFEYRAVSDAIGIVYFAFFIFPVLRITLRGKLALGPPRWAVWAGVEVLLSIATFLVVYALIIVGILLWPNLGMTIPSQWQEFILEVLIVPFLLGVFVWQVGLVLGRESPLFRRAHGYVFGERKAIVALYLIISVSDVFVSWALVSLLEGEAQLVMDAAFSARYAIYTWLLSLLCAALYVELADSERALEEIFG